MIIKLCRQSQYSLIYGAMGSTFVRGLAATAFLTLFIVPVLWDMVQGVLERRAISIGYKRDISEFLQYAGTYR